MNRPLMDSAVGDDLLASYSASNPGVVTMANLQGAVGLLQLQHIDAFNEGARRNAALLTRCLGDVPGLGLPDVSANHIYVYYPIAVDAERRDDLRNHLLRRGVDAKITDMSDCSRLHAFCDGDVADKGAAREASLLEICVYPVISERQIRRIADAIREWAGVAK